MSRKRLALLGFIVAAALAAAGVAAARRGAPSVQPVTGDVQRHDRHTAFADDVLRQRRRHVPGHQGDVLGNGDERRSASRRRTHDPRLEPRRHHQRCRPLVRQLPHRGSRQSTGPRDAQRRDRGWQRIRPGARLRAGQVGPRRRIARLGVQPHDGLLLGLDRVEHRRRGLPALRSLVSPGQLARERRRVARRPGSTGASQSRRPGPLS